MQQPLDPLMSTRFVCTRFAMEAQVLAPLNVLEASLSTLISNLTTTPTFSNAPSSTEQLLSADETLTSALSTLHTHQENYARIHRLREEATRLEEQVKDIIRTCDHLRNEIGLINPAIVDDTSDSDEDNEGGTGRPAVDQKDLLSFARRIGRYNTLAAREMEAAATKRKLDRGTSGTTTDVPVNETVWLNDTAAQTRALQGMAFPAAERLRVGMLGHLQRLREDGGDEAVDSEVERLLAGGQMEEAMIAGTDRPQEPQPQRPQRQASTFGATRPPPERKSNVKLDLDLWNEDDDDEE